MKRIDLYVVRRFVFYYCASLAGFTFMLVVVDISGRIGTLSAGGNFPAAVLAHYGGEIPFYLDLLLPIVCVLAAVFTVTSLKRRNELVCLLSAGTSIHRVIGCMCAVIFLTVPLFVLNNEIVKPYLSRRRIRTRHAPLRTSVVTPRYVSVVCADSLSSSPARASNFTAAVMERRTGRLLLFLFSPTAAWSAGTGTWRFAPRGTIVSTGESLAIDPEAAQAVTRSLPPLLLADPDRLRISARSPSHLSTRELLRLMPSVHAELELYHRFTFPLLMFILVMAVVPFSVDHDRNIGAFVGIGLALAAVFLAYGVMYLAIFLGGKGILPPWAAGTAPLAACLPPAAFIYGRMKT